MDGGWWVGGANSGGRLCWWWQVEEGEGRAWNRSGSELRSRVSAAALCGLGGTSQLDPKDIILVLAKGIKLLLD